MVRALDLVLILEALNLWYILDGRRAEADYRPGGYQLGGTEPYAKRSIMELWSLKVVPLFGMIRCLEH